MARTQIRGTQVLDGSVRRADLNTTDTGNAVVRRIIAGTGVTLDSTGVDSGTGDVTINSSGGQVVLAGDEASLLYEVETTDNTETSIAEIEIAEDSTETFFVFLTARGPSNKNYWSQLQFSARRNTASNAVLVGSVVVTDDEENTSGYLSTADVNSGNIRIRVTGATSETVSWQARVFRSSTAGSGELQFPDWDSPQAYQIDLIREVAALKGQQHRTKETLHRQTLSGTLSGSNKWAGGVLAPNGFIYGIPFNSTSILKINPTAFSQTTFGSVGAGTGKWFGGVLAPNGKIYCIPCNSTSVLVIDPSDDSTYTFGSLGAGAKWRGGVLASNGKIYCIPQESTSILVIDPSDDSTYTFGSLSGATKWFGGALANDGQFVVGFPYNSTTYLKIDTTIDSASTYGSISGTDKFIGGVTALNGDAYPTLFSSTGLHVVRNGEETSGPYGSASGTFKYNGACVTPGGSIYCAPSSVSTILKVDPGSVNFSSIPHNLSLAENSFAGAVLSPNGVVWFIPYSHTAVMYIQACDEVDINFCLNPYFNKF